MALSPHLPASVTYGILGNTSKESLWEPVANLTRWLHRHDRPFCLHRDVAAGLEARDLVDAAFCSEYATDDVAAKSDVLLSFGGDGTLLRSAQQVGTRETPLLGVNIGRLGFLAKVEVEELEAVVQQIEEGEYGIERRMALDVAIDGVDPDVPRWALNDFVLDKSGTASMIAIEAEVDGTYLNTYWADGLIVATPTGSTAYSMSVDGPIMAPGSDVFVLTPIAPHTLTARPIVLPASSVITLRVSTRDHPFVVATDGVSAVLDNDDVTFTLRRAAHGVRLVTLPGRDYYTTIREKLSWGQSRVF